MKVAAIGDLHVRVQPRGEVSRLLRGVEHEADVLILAGDLTNRGRLEEMEVLTEELREICMPMVAIDGNHDHENEHIELLANMLESLGVHFLRGSACVIGGVGFVGAKGFAGGFGPRRAQPFGERAIKVFLQETIDQVLGLETALKGLEAARRVAVLHYSPIPQTLEGEALEIYPFLGSSLLGDALDRHHVDLIVHGHAHNGSADGRTAGGIPVRNVARFVQARLTERSYHLFEI